MLFRSDRAAASKILVGATTKSFDGDKNKFIAEVEQALYAGFVITYAQGLEMLKASSDLYKYETDITAVAKIWRGGCIIRAELLKDITATYEAEPIIKNILMGSTFSKSINESQASLRNVVITAMANGIPMPSFAACLNYFDALRSAWLPANLIQAQRDFFGAHTYERLDKEGTFHTEWNVKIQ